jgi:hypothetical protein
MSYSPIPKQTPPKTDLRPRSPYLTDGTRTHFRPALDSVTASITAMQRAPSRKVG